MDYKKFVKKALLVTITTSLVVLAVICAGCTDNTTQPTQIDVKYAGTWISETNNSDYNSHYTLTFDKNGGLVITVYNPNSNVPKTIIDCSCNNGNVYSKVFTVYDSNDKKSNRILTVTKLGKFEYDEENDTLTFSTATGSEILKRKA